MNFRFIKILFIILIILVHGCDGGNEKTETPDPSDNNSDTPSSDNDNDNSDTTVGSTVFVSGGSGYTLGINNDGSVWAVGTGPLGELGHVENTRDKPVVVVGLSNVTAVDAGINHAAALKSDNTVWCWGDNFYGQLGNGTTIDSSTPVQVPDLSGVVDIAIGKNEYSAYTIALKDEGTVWAWGDNGSGQLGNDSNTDSSGPVQVSGLVDVTDVAAGGRFSVALKSDGTVWAWGYNGFGQLGDGTTTDQYTPVQITGLSGITAISAGYSHTLALESDGTVWAWGANGSGKLGDGTTENRTSPIQVSGLSDITAIAAGASHSLALESDGTVWAWGDNGYGQLGDGTMEDKHTAVELTNLSDVDFISAGRLHSAIVKTNSTVWNWGSNSGGQLGVDQPDDFPSLGPPYDDRPDPRLLEYTDEPLVAIKIQIFGDDEGFSRIDIEPDSEEYVTMSVCDCNDDLCECSPLFANGEDVTLSPSAWNASDEENDNYTKFTSWSGCDSVDGDQCVITVSNDDWIDVIGQFELRTE